MEEENKSKNSNEWLAKRNSVIVGNIPESCDSVEKLAKFFEASGKCEVHDFNLDAHTARLFYPHHKGTKKAKKMDGKEFDGQQISVDWFFVYNEKSDSSADDQKEKKSEKKDKPAKKSTKTDDVQKATKTKGVSTVDDIESLQKKLDAEIKSRVKLDSKVEQMRQEIKELKDLVEKLTSNSKQ